MDQSRSKISGVDSTIGCSVGVTEVPGSPVLNPLIWNLDVFNNGLGSENGAFLLLFHVNKIWESTGKRLTDAVFTDGLRMGSERKTKNN